MTWRGQRRKSELPADWESIRRRVLRRDGGLCVFCGSKATDVDHIDPRGPHVPENLRSLCQHCHMARTAEQSRQARRRNGWTKGKRRGLRPPQKHPGLR